MFGNRQILQGCLLGKNLTQGECTTVIKIVFTLTLKFMLIRCSLPPKFEISRQYYSGNQSNSQILVLNGKQIQQS
ncbi:unnamed protein product [Paramecium sonneborni]|uniref:Uncharacterized protein n=1 Tax=Paramecium sonneborni TaxID=65129 RepID=A0A8S1RRF0_9CILI|nr:unnamed protein product [Paramecium sonneborni]